MATDSAIVGVSDHAGWAVLVSATGDGTLVDRRRVALIDADLPAMPYHHQAQRLPLAQAVALVERVRVSAERHAALRLAELAAELPAPIRGIALRQCPLLPATIEERLRSYWAQNRADGVMYRQALAAGASARGWRVHWYNARTVLDRAGERVADLDARFAAIRQTQGPPWQRDHRIAMTAAIVASAEADR